MSGITVKNNGLEYDFYKFLNETVLVYIRTGLSSAGGKPTYGIQTSYQCRIEHTPHMVRAATGEQVVSSTAINFPTVINIQPHDKIVLPDGTQPVILAIEQETNEYGPYRLVVHT